MAGSALAPSLDEIERLALAALDTLPEPFAGPARDLLIVVQDFADAEILEDMGIADPFELTGLYQGIALTEKSHDNSGAMPDTVFLYRRAILDEWIARGDVTLAALVGHVLVHEIAHHFGWSDDDITAVDDWRL